MTAVSPVAVFVQPIYNGNPGDVPGTPLTGSAYPLALDAAIRAMQRVGDAFAPRPSSPQGMTVTVDPGMVFYNGALTELASQTTGTITAPVSNPRIDRVVRDVQTGTISVVTGTEAASPTAPAIPSGKVPVAQVSLLTSTTVIGTAQISDERVWHDLPVPGELPSKGSPTTSDLLLIGDAAAGNAPKTATITSVLALATGALTEIATATASASASVAFTSGIGSTYDEYEIHFNSVLLSGINALGLQVSQDGGSTWKTTGYDWVASGTAGPSAPNALTTGTASDSSIGVSGGQQLSTTSHFVASGVIKFSRPAGSDLTQFLFDMAGITSSSLGTGLFRISGSGLWGTAGAINAVRLIPSSGTITTGNFKLYGVQK